MSESESRKNRDQAIILKAYKELKRQYFTIQKLLNILKASKEFCVQISKTHKTFNSNYNLRNLKSTQSGC